MKKLFSLFLAFAMLFSLSSTALAVDATDGTAFLDAMKDIAKNEGVTLTENCIAIKTTLYQTMRIVIETESDAELQGLICYAFQMEDKTIAPTFNGISSSVCNFSATNKYSLDTRTGGGVDYSLISTVADSTYILFNLLTSLDQNTTITIKMYGEVSASSQIDENKDLRFTTSYTFEAPEEIEAPSVTYMNISATDVSETYTGIQVYTDDPVTVTFTDSQGWGDGASTKNYIFRYDPEVFQLESDLGTPGLTDDKNGTITGTGSDFSLKEIEFKALPQEQDRVAGEFSFKATLDSVSANSETVEVMLKTIQYTVLDIHHTDPNVPDGYFVYKTYDGTPQTFEITVKDPVGATIAYDTDNDSAYDDEKPEYTEPSGQARIIFKISAKGYKDLIGVIIFAIEKATVTITPKNVTITAGDALPASFEYDITGLIGSDQLKTEPTITCSKYNGKAGTYDITATGASAGDNYKILYKPGTLTVKEKTVTPGGGSGGGTHAYYTLYFVTNGGSAIGSVTGSAGSLVDLGGYVPVRSGYAFTGWYADPALTKPVYSVRLTGSTTVYAGWRPLMTPPKTGDGPSAWGWVCLLPLGCLGLAALWRRRAR